MQIGGSLLYEQSDEYSLYQLKFHTRCFLRDTEINKSWVNNSKDYY